MVILIISESEYNCTAATGDLTNTTNSKVSFLSICIYLVLVFLVFLNSVIWYSYGHMQFEAQGKTKDRYKTVFITKNCSSSGIPVTKRIHSTSRGQQLIEPIKGKCNLLLCVTTASMAALYYWPAQGQLRHCSQASR